MSYAITHFAVGAASTAIIVAVVAPQLRYRGTVIVLGGIWALVPDVGKLYAHPAIVEFHSSRWADLFWLHRTMDVYDRGHSVWLATVSVLVLVIVMAVTEYAIGDRRVARQLDLPKATEDD